MSHQTRLPGTAVTVPEWHHRATTSTADTGCACPGCLENIANTHGPIVVPTSQIRDRTVRARLSSDFIRACGWYCSSCRLFAVRDMESPNSVWSELTNPDEQYVGIAVDRPGEGDWVLAAVDRRDLPPSVLRELGRYCPACRDEYGSLITAARIPCQPCRGDGAYRRWTKPWDEGDVRKEPQLVPSPDWEHRRRWEVL